MDLTDRLAAERRGRLAAERLLELKSRELFEANRKLSQHAYKLSGQIIEQRGEAERLKEQSAQVKADLARAEEHVEVIERRLWDSVETISDGFAVFDPQDRLIAANTAWLSIFNYSDKIGPGTLYLELLRIAIEERHVDLQGESPGEWIATMLERWDAPSPTDAQEIRLQNGAWYRFVDRRARDGDMVCVAQDITTLKEREVELDDARHKAEAANRAKSAFLANMSHELRTPMNGVVAMSEMLLESEMADEQRLYVSTIKSSGEALLEIINHVLDFSKMEAERMVLRPDPFDLERLLHEVVTLLGPTARDKKLGLHVDYDLFSPTQLVGDAMRIRQILINLVGNAVKFTEEGHVLIRVLCHDEGAEGWGLTITVEDTGIGIPEDLQEHIFGSFAQVETEKNRKFEGTGLGLAITRELVQLMGGEIWVASEPGEGACFGFRITLPSAEPTKRLLPLIDTTIGRAMVVAPDGHEGAIMVRQLSQLGLEVVQATTGSDALALVRSRPPVQITVIDDTLPDTTGTELARALAEADCPSARLLVCTSMQEAARLQSGRPSGAFPEGLHAVLTRPVLRSDLFAAIARLPAREVQADAGVGSPVPMAERPRVEGNERALVAALSTIRPAEAPVDPPADGARLAQQPQPHVEMPEEASVCSPQDEKTPPATAGHTTPAPAKSAEAAELYPVHATRPEKSAPQQTEAPRLMRVLAAEDNKTNRFVLSKLLSRLDIDLHFAVDGQEAVDLYESLAPDLILMDISMPRLDGKDAARAIRAQEAALPLDAARHVPIVAMTAHALDGDKEDILASGIDHYLTKPLRRAEIMDYIVAHCPDACQPVEAESRAVAG
ncbi:MAG: ATP-binding protein [Pseudomonadota bacterium]